MPTRPSALGCSEIRELGLNLHRADLHESTTIVVLVYPLNNIGQHQAIMADEQRGATYLEIYRGSASVSPDPDRRRSKR